MILIKNGLKSKSFEHTVSAVRDVNVKLYCSGKLEHNQAKVTFQEFVKNYAKLQNRKDI